MTRKEFLITFFYLCFLYSCASGRCGGGKPLDSSVISILLEQGFTNDTISIRYGNDTLLRARVTTNPSSDVAHDFIGLNYNVKQGDEIVIYFNGDNHSYSLRKYSCFQTLILRKKAGRLSLSGSNNKLDYQ